MAQFTVNAQRFDPYKNFKFRVRWDGRYVAGVSKVSGLKRTTEVIEHRQGGDPSMVHKSPGRTKYDAITLERGVTHDRDLIFLATADEESGGAFGMPWVIANHPRFVDAEFAINEGGRVRIVEGRTRYAAIQTAEKIPYVVTMKAIGPGGHASVPLEGMAIPRLARALAVVSSTRLPIALSPTTRAFFAKLGPIWPDRSFGEAMVEIAAKGDDADPRAVAQVARAPRFDALLRDTIAPAMLAAGTRHNVIPPSAQATLSLRVLPGHRPEAVLRHLAQIIDDPDVTLAIDSRGCEAPASDLDSPLFQAMEAALAAIDPDIIAVPYLSTGATESAYLRAAGIQCCGILPFPLTEDDESRMHGNDERLAVEAFAFGARLISGTVTRQLDA